jgi:Protein of unknown function (DUF2827)
VRSYTVGITIYVGASGDLGLYENGLRQNAIFFFNLFRASPNCRRVWLLNHGDGEVASIPEGLPVGPGDIVRTAQVAGELDFVLVLGAAMDAATAEGLRKRGCRIIGYKGGNGIVISMEAIIAQPPRGDAERYFDRSCYDALWMTPQHIHTYRSYCETIYRCPVVEVPQIWQPLFLDRRAGALQQPFGYQPGAARKRIGILDPNITVMKTSHMPMLVCEAAYRQRPELFQAVYVTNAIQFMQNEHFNSLANRLRMFRDKVATVEPRFVTADFLAHHADAVVTHHWENGLNYLFYDVLSGGYPLVHNSAFLREYGYYYESFDAESGGEALLRALSDHDAGLQAYRATAKRLLDRVDAASPANVSFHEKLLFETP